MKNLNFVAKQLEKYLNLAQEFTEDYHLTMKLGGDPMRIISEESEKLKRIDAMIYVCRDQLKHTDHEITCSASGFRVDIINHDVPI
jgi:hypothetical protein